MYTGNILLLPMFPLSCERVRASHKP